MENVIEKMVVKVPASTANMGSGFDAIGVAFQLYLTLTVEKAEQTCFDWQDAELDDLNIRDEDNLILKGIVDLYASEGVQPPSLKVTVKSDIPLTRGLGSSASAYVGGLVIGNELLGKPLDNDQLLWLATKEEGHPDNVGASIMGGVFVASVDWEKEKVYYHQHNFPEKWIWLAAIPSYPLSTSMARHLLPEKYPKQDAIFNLGRFGLLVAALITGQKEGIIVGLEDSLHQPYRQVLIPGFKELCALRERLDVLGFVISGAGPTVLALTEKKESYQPIMDNMKELLSTADSGVLIKQLSVDQLGYQVYYQEAHQSGQTAESESEHIGT